MLEHPKALSTKKKVKNLKIKQWAISRKPNNTSLLKKKGIIRVGSSETTRETRTLHIKTFCLAVRQA